MNWGRRFWRGGYPGFSLEMRHDADVDKDIRNAIQQQIDAYHNGLQRYMICTGVTWRSFPTRPSWYVRWSYWIWDSIREWV